MSTPLLQQMDRMMSMWDTIGGNDMEGELQRADMARSVLALFASGSGVYHNHLQKALNSVFRIVDHLVAERHADRQSGVVLPVAAALADSDTTAYDTLRQQGKRMDNLVVDATNQRTALQQTIRSLQDEKTHLELLLAHQMMKNQRTNIVEDDIQKLVKRGDAEKLADELSVQLDSANEELRLAKQHVGSLRELNAKYAAQALELSARLRVITEHNQKMGSTLSVQQDDLMVAEKECELAKAQLAESQRANRLLTEALDNRGDLEHRDAVVGRGVNHSVPKHLQCSDYVRHVPMTKELATHLVFDILHGRKTKSSTSSLASYAASFLTQRYGSDGMAYSYALDLACKMFDADVSLQLFDAVANNQISEEIYQVIASDVKTFCDACGSADLQLHGKTMLSIPFSHVVSILVHMYPGYPARCIENLVDALDSSQTNTGVVYYGTLFPNTLRDELVGLEATNELSRESAFSALFKQLILDDAKILHMKVEDRLLATLSDTTVTHEVLERVRVMDVVGSKIEVPIQHFLDTSFDPGSTIGVWRLVTSLRTSVLLRSGLTSNTDAPHAAIADRAVQQWMSLTGEQPKELDYDALVGQSVRPEFFVGRRGTVNGVLIR